jgi:hypothetical protein
MSQQLISRSPDLKRLRDEGYHLEIRQTFLVIHDVPYLGADRAVRRGTLVCSMALAGEATTTPDDHTMHFAGDLPHDHQGQPLSRIIANSGPQVMADGLQVDHYFSSKPLGGTNYPDYYAKVTTYVTILESQAQAIDPSATARTHPVLVDDEPDSVFRYSDNASSRAGISVITDKLRLSRLAIVGLGGTGSYVLDLVAKTPVNEIHLIDGDVFLQHNAFRTPGAALLEELQAKPLKVDYVAERYDPMRRNIIPHGVYLSEDNLDLLDEVDFVFICIDAGDAKRLIVDRLEAAGTTFIDVGIGVQARGDQLGGIVRTTLSRADRREDPRSQIGFAPPHADDVYEQNIQVADLNALNATLAVIRWKKHFGFYQDFDDEHTSLYTIDGNQLTNLGASA